ncbi:MAG: T9SS type A sorting domain-containing protein [Bacteroidia bacterium]|nr:T9SS type A sorting domain-containing protein [Bacteroidia bacterium]
MKKLYAITLSLGVCAGLMAQRPSTGETVQAPVNSNAKNGNPSVMVTPTDTLWGNFPMGGGTASPTIFSSTGGGFVGGHNGYGDLKKVQAFMVTSPYSVEGICYWFGGKVFTSGNNTSKVVSSLWAMTGTGTASTGNAPCPANNPIANTSNDIMIGAIDTTSSGAGGFVFVTLPSPYAATVDYGAGINLAFNSAGDTVGLVSTEDGGAGMMDQSWEQWSDNTWHTAYEPQNWGLNIDWAIFPIVNMNSGIADGNFINGIKLYQNFPNPTMGNTTVSFELENSAKDVMIVINDLNGKLIKKIELKNLNAGKHELNLDAKEIGAGTFFILLQADNNRLGKKMTVVH